MVEVRASGGVSCMLLISLFLLCSVMSDVFLMSSFSSLLHFFHLICEPTGDEWGGGIVVSLEHWGGGIVVSLEH